MEFVDGKTRLTHIVAALSSSDQQEADKLLDDPLSCHVWTVPDSHYKNCPVCPEPGPEEGSGSVSLETHALLHLACEGTSWHFIQEV
jgi:hypothetical protein